MIKWFLLQDDRVLGPFKSDEVKSQITSGQLTQSSLIWGRPLENWYTINSWLKDTVEFVQTLDSEVTESEWHYAIDGVSKGPLTRLELINEIKALRNRGEILVWTKGMKAWADLYEFHDLLDDIGLNRREHPRSSASGSVTIKFGEKSIHGALKTISPGGFGASQLDAQLAIGQVVVVDIRSERLSEPITVRATVQYSSDTGFYGFKFVAINMEAKSIILDYVRTSKNQLVQAA